MYIEIYTPHGEVQEKTIRHVREQLMELHKKNKEITRAEIHFRSLTIDSVCEVELMINDNLIFVHRKAASYEQAAKQVLKELTERFSMLKKRD